MLMISVTSKWVILTVTVNNNWFIPPVWSYSDNNRGPLKWLKVEKEGKDDAVLTADGDEEDGEDGGENEDEGLPLPRDIT